MRRVSRSDQSLDGIGLLTGLTDAQRSELAKKATWRRYSPGESILHYLDESGDVFFVVAGRVRALNYSRSGRQVSYRDIDAGEMFGEFSAIDGEPRSSSVVAASSCVIASLSADRFWQLLREQPSVAAALLRHFTKLLRYYSERVKELATLPVRIRVQVELLRLGRRDGRDGDRLIIEHPRRFGRSDRHQPGSRDPRIGRASPRRRAAIQARHLDHRQGELAGTGHRRGRRRVASKPRSQAARIFPGMCQTAHISGRQAARLPPFPSRIGHRSRLFTRGGPSGRSRTYDRSPRYRRRGHMIMAGDRKTVKDVASAWLVVVGFFLVLFVLF
jgi:CRP/FNR family cyclic AMP-dependent transcriptional regulator